MNDDDQEMQQSVVSKDCGDDNDALAEDKKSPMLEEEDMLAIPKLGEGGHLVGSERRIVRECYGMEVEEDDHCLKEGESGYEDEDGDHKQIEEKDDSTEGDISPKSCIARYSNALESSEESMQHEDDDTLSISVLSSNSDFEVESLPFKRRKRRKRVCVHKLNSLLYFKQWFMQ